MKPKRRRTPYLTKFAVEIYNWTVYVFLNGKTGATFISKRWPESKEKHEETWRNSTGGVCSIDLHAMDCYIGVFNADHGTAAHEILHAAYHILDHASVTHNAQSHEALTYLVGFLTRKFYGAVERENKRMKCA